MFWFNFINEKQYKVSVLAPTWASANRALPKDLGSVVYCHAAPEPEFDTRIMTDWEIEDVRYYIRDSGVVKQVDGVAEITAIRRVLGQPESQQFTNIDEALKWVEEAE